MYKDYKKIVQMTSDKKLKKMLKYLNYDTEYYSMDKEPNEFNDAWEKEIIVKTELFNRGVINDIYDYEL